MKVFRVKFVNAASPSLNQMEEVDDEELEEKLVEDFRFFLLAAMLKPLVCLPNPSFPRLFLQKPLNWAAMLSKLV